MSSPAYIDRATLKELSVLQPWKTALAIVLDWAAIAVAIAVSVWADSWPVYLASVVVIAGRMHALGVLIHDFAHYRFIRNKRMSEWIGDFFLAWPILITVNGYRQTHLAHHIHTNTHEDPDYTARYDKKPFIFPMSWQYMAVHMAGYLVAVRTLMDVMEFHTGKISRKETRAYVFLRLGFYGVIAFLIGSTGIWREFLAYWVVPFVTLFFAFMYVRAVAEHFSLDDYSSLESGTRTVLPHFWERPFFSPHNVNFHSEHHLYPGVPYYNLPQLHAVLMANPDFASRVQVTRGYTTGLVAECLAPRKHTGHASPV